MAWLENFKAEKINEAIQKVDSDDHTRKRLFYESKSKLVKRLMLEAVEEHYNGYTNKNALVEAVIKLYEEGKAMDLKEALDYLEQQKNSTSYLND